MVETFEIYLSDSEKDLNIFKNYLIREQTKIWCWFLILNSGYFIFDIQAKIKFIVLSANILTCIEMNN